MKPMINLHRLSSSRQKGMVLILVLMVFAFSAIVASELAYQSHREVRRTANILNQSQLILLAKGGEAFAIQKLLADFIYDKQSGLQADYLTEVWAVEGEPYGLAANTVDGTALDAGKFVSGGFQEQQDESDSISETGNVVIIIEDLQARFNVNNVQYAKEGHMKGSDQFANVLNAILLQGQQVANYDVYNQEATSVFDEKDSLVEQTQIHLDIPPADIALAVKDWVDTNQNSELATGAEDDFYATRKPPYRAANQAIAHISELKAIKGFSQEKFWVYNLLLAQRFDNSASMASSAEGEKKAGNLSLNREEEPKVARYDYQGNLMPELPVADEHWGGVRHYVAALPFPSKINVNTAPVEVLQALFTAEQAQKIVTGRSGSPYQQVNDIFLNLEDIQAEKRANYIEYLSVYSEYFLATIVAEIDETRLTLHSTLYRDRKGRVKVLVRDFSGN